MHHSIRSVQWSLFLLVMFVFASAAHAVDPLQLMSSAPSNNAINIQRTGVAVLSFSAALDPNTLATGHVQLLYGNSGQSISPNVSGNSIVIFYDYELLPNTTYTLTASGIRGSAGERLNGTVSITFTTTDGAWQSAQPLVTNGHYIQSSRFAIDYFYKTAMTVWTEHTAPNHTDLFSSYYSSGQWSPPQLVNSSDSQGEVFDSAVAMGPGGVIVAVWEEYYGSGYNNTDVHFRIWGNRYLPDAGWGTPQLIDTDSSSGGFAPQVAVNAYGKAVVVWYQYDHGTQRIFSNEFDVSSGWGTVVAIDPVSHAPGSFNPRIAFDPIGYGYAIWEQWWHGVVLIWGNRYMPGRGWVAPQIIQSDRTTSSDEPQIAFDGDGNAIAVWKQGKSIHAARYIRDQGWGADVAISNDGDDYDPAVATTRNGKGGDTFVSWTQISIASVDGHGIPHTRGTVWATRFTTSGGWETPQMLQFSNGYDAGSTSLAVDNAGNAMAVWSAFNGTYYRIYANRYEIGKGWVNRKVIDTTNTVGASNPQIQIDFFGNAMAVWEQQAPTNSMGGTELWFNQFQ